MYEEIEKYLSHKKTIIIGIIIIIIVFIFLGGWGFFAKMDLAVKAPGTIIATGYSKNIKYMNGGIVKKILVKEGDYVKKGQILIKIDTSKQQSELKNYQKQYYQLLAQKERILGELNNTNPKFSSYIPNSIKKEQFTIYKAQLKNLNDQIKDYNYKIQQEKDNIKILINNLKTNNDLLNSYKNELKKWNILYKKNLVDESKILDLKRKIIQTQGEIDSIKYQIAQKQSLIKNYRNQIKILKSNFNNNLLTKLQDINTKLPTILGNISILKTEINHANIKAPSNGIVQNLQIHTPGEVISPYENIMQIIPKEGNKIIVEAKISPLDIDKVKVGEYADIILSSFVDPSAKPIQGKIIYVSPDVIKDKYNPKYHEYYKALIEITPKGMQAIKENGFHVVPGMPAMVYIKAGKRAFLTYIIYPMKQLLKGAFHAN